MNTALAHARRWWALFGRSRRGWLASAAPLVSVALFGLMVLTGIVFLRQEESQRQHQAIQRDLLYAQTQLREHLTEHKDQIMRLAQDMGRGALDAPGFLQQTKALLRGSPEIWTITWIDANKRCKISDVKATAYAAQWPRKSSIQSLEPAASLFDQVQRTLWPMYSKPYFIQGQNEFIELQAPILSDSPKEKQQRFQGVVRVEISLADLLTHGISEELQRSYTTAWVRPDNTVHWPRTPGSTAANSPLPLGGPETGGLWQSVSRALGLRVPQQEVRSRFFLNDNAPIAQGTSILAPSATPSLSAETVSLELAMRNYTSAKSFISQALQVLVFFLALLTLWMLLINWRSTRRRQKAQHDLKTEIAFRRTMERSMPTGVRALDLQRRITYVNAAFCQMTGWGESDLMGTVPPYPYWPKNEIEALEQHLESDLNAMVYPLVREMRVQRKDGSIFDARMFIAPLIDAKDVQTGWMASMMDITEPKRIRQELAIAFNRFTTILEGMDASISVSTLKGQQLLFVNKTYREWFGLTSRIQSDFVDLLLNWPSPSLCDTEGSPIESHELFVDALNRWLEVRVRTLNWVDGQWAQMVIANDITERKRSEQQAQESFEKAQATSRLITMGEMASSMAHELNQPLAAIVNYCSGMRARLQHLQQEGQKRQQGQEALPFDPSAFDVSAFVTAVEKTQAQAQRAGQIIHRIRHFVKKNEPNRTPSDAAHMVSEAIELAGFEVRRRRVQLIEDIPQTLPLLTVDPILIEQVLVNLIKNAAEAIDSTDQPLPQRRITLRVMRQRLEDEEGLAFSVEDSGPGLDQHKSANLFEAFYSTKSEGMGIGLSLCRSIIESHKGRLSACNAYNGKALSGAIFTFWLPLASVPLGSSAPSVAHNDSPLPPPH